MRLDLYLTKEGYFPSRAKSVEAINSGYVYINGIICEKPSKEIVTSDKVEIRGQLRFVSKGGYKLEKALLETNLDLSGKIFADIGASTGGFTDCLLQFGVKKVYAVDVGNNQLDKSLVESGKVIVLDNTNARYLEKTNFQDKLDGITADCSFISIKILLPVFEKLIDNEGIILALIKPQFECGKGVLPKSGILKDKKIRAKVVLDVISEASNLGFKLISLIKAPQFSDKNCEYIAYFTKRGRALEEKYLKGLLDI